MVPADVAGLELSSSLTNGHESWLMRVVVQPYPEGAMLATPVLIYNNVVTHYILGVIGGPFTVWQETSTDNFALL